MRGMEADPIFGSFSQDNLHPVTIIVHGVVDTSRPEAKVVAVQTHLERIERKGVDQEIIHQTLAELEFELT